jgi:hypothetical protein
MAHRQSGGYKEEPGVAVAGDHVSTQPSLYLSWATLCIISGPISLVGLAFSQVKSDVGTQVIIPLSRKSSKFASCASLVQGCKDTAHRWPGGGVLQERRCFDNFQKITSKAGLEVDFTATFVGPFHNQLGAARVHASRTRVSSRCPIPPADPSWASAQTLTNLLCSISRLTVKMHKVHRTCFISCPLLSLRGSCWLVGHGCWMRRKPSVSPSHLTLAEYVLLLPLVRLEFGPPLLCAGTGTGSCRHATMQLYQIHIISLVTSQDDGDGHVHNYLFRELIDAIFAW